MIQSESIAQLATALSKAQGKMTHAIKDANNPFFHSKYADLASVVEASRPALVANGLSVIQCTEGNVLWTMLLHESGEWIKGRIELRPMRQVKDSGWVESHDPQSYGSCITYARRYAMAAITGVATEDDDGNAASGNKVVAPKGAANPVHPPTVEKPPPVPEGTHTSPLTTEEKKDDATLRHELQALAGIATGAGLYSSESDALSAWSSYTKDGVEKPGYKDVLKMKGWQMTRAIDKALAQMNHKSSTLDEVRDDDITL